MHPLLRPALVGAVALLIGGCDALINRPLIARDFGAPYAVRLGAVASFPEAPARPTPAVTAAGDLWVVVAYHGGCAEHTFTPDVDGLSPGRTVVWLHHDAGGETCRGVVEDTLRIRLAASLRPGTGAPALSLATPEGDEVPLTAPSGGTQ